VNRATGAIRATGVGMNRATERLGLQNAPGVAPPASRDYRRWDYQLITNPTK
jgi:hypothetical protein